MNEAARQETNALLRDVFDGSSGVGSDDCDEHMEQIVASARRVARACMEDRMGLCAASEHELGCAIREHQIARALIEMHARWHGCRHCGDHNNPTCQCWNDE